MARRGLVLGGGGVGGIAWTLGLLAGLRDGGVAALDADVVVGTSAGATVAAQATSGVDLDVLLDRQLDGSAGAAEIPAGVPLDTLFARYAELGARTDDPLEARRRVAAAALGADVVAPERRRAVIAQRLPVHDWPARELRICALDADTGALRVLTAADGVDLVDAVAASCAIPLVWPPVVVGAERLVDGGARDFVNADVAGDCTRVLVLAPAGSPDPPSDVAAARTQLEERSAVLEVLPDEPALAAMGPDPLDVSVIAAVAAVGREQGAREATRVGAFWRAYAP